jgi:two-component system NtrC family sensor kinase
MPTEFRQPYRGLRRYIVTILCLAAAIPLAFIGGGIYYEYSRSIGENVKIQLTTIVQHHKEAIEGFLAEVSSAMKVVARLQPQQRISRDEPLEALFASLQREYGQAFEDMGVIDHRGDHLAYVGPYDLRGRNYAEAPWFREAMEKKIFVSDVFLGFRRVPHFIIAVKQEEAGGAWILRATVNASKFERLVEGVRLGRTGESFIVNREGTYQTRSRSGGNLMERAGADFIDPAPFDGVRFSETERGGKRVLRAKTWLKGNGWVLVVQQDVEDAYAELHTTRNRAVIVFVVGAVMIGVVAFSTTALLVRKIEKADQEKRLLDQQLIQSQKLASIGQLSAGVAHEINNPLAVIGEEAGWMMDLLKRKGSPPIPELDEFKDSLREIGVQTGRCREITHKLLSFARKMDFELRDVDVNRLIDDVLGMRAREAAVNDIAFVTEYAADLPAIHSDPSLLRQVMLNLVNNAMDAMPRGGVIRIETCRGADCDSGSGTEEADQGSVAILVRDNGVGIAAENVSRIFDPFFTTKEPGKGTGLGLSICHGIVQKLGGTIAVSSRAGQGTTFTLIFPIEQRKGAM